jgi:hypothetical protein
MTDETKSPDMETAEPEGRNEESDVPAGAAADVAARISQLEEDTAARDSEIAALRDTLEAAVSKYRAAVAATAPGVPEELLRGATVEETDASLETARRIVSQVREQIERESAAESVPAGAPPRTPPDMSALSPAEKIFHALSAERS